MIKEHILALVTDGELKGDALLPSEHQLCRQFNLSRMTVRRGLSELEKEGYIYSVAGKGRFVRDDRMESRAKSVSRLSIMVGMHDDFLSCLYSSNFYCTQLLNGLQNAFVLYDVRGQFAVTQTMLQNDLIKTTDGIILVSPGEGEAEVVRSIQKLGIPLVLINPHVTMDDVSYIKIENYLSSKMLVKYLIDLGHRKIGCISCSLDYNYIRERRQGYADVLKENGIEVRTDWILEIEDPFHDHSRDVWEWWLRNSDLTALFILGGNLQRYSLKNFIMHGINIPDDLSVVAFDELPPEEGYPRPTLVRQPLAAMGEKSVEAMVSILKGSMAKPVRLELAPELIIGETCIPLVQDNKERVMCT
ncbi:MAG: GntR family transcriptional regulator [bacterium]|nr:GntR family transcriptional regulator [bacterium]